VITAEKPDTVSVGPHDPQFRFIDGLRLVPRAEIRISDPHGEIPDIELNIINKWIRLGYIKAYANMTSEEYVLASLRNGQ